MEGSGNVRYDGVESYECSASRTLVETQIRLKAGGGTCPEEIKIPPTPGVQLMPEWFETQSHDVL